jgi:hypothetical protein
MSTIQQVREKFSKRTKERSFETNRLIGQLRDCIQAIVGESDPQPNPDEIIGLCDALGVSVAWFEKAVENCRLRFEECEATKEMPALNRKHSILMAEYKDMAPQVDEARTRLKLAELDLANPNAFHEFDVPFLLDKTPEDFAELRRIQAEVFEIYHRHWEIKRQYKLIEVRLRELYDKLNPGVSDPNCGRERPWDFALPEMP